MASLYVWRNASAPVLIDDGEIRFRLTRQSSERVDALVTYVRQNTAGFAAQRGRIVFSGGWAGAAEGFGRPPPQYREGSLMLAHAMAADIGGSSWPSMPTGMRRSSPTAR